MMAIRECKFKARESIFTVFVCIHQKFSLYLFVLAMEVLNCFLRSAREGGYLIGFKVFGRNGESLEVTFMLFTTSFSIL